MEIYYAPTPNGFKVTILLEELVELGVMKDGDYKICPVNLAKGEQFEESFLKISPNGRMPALKDGDKTVFESGAMMIYIAEKYGNMFYPQHLKYETLQWLFWQVGGLGPMAGQVSHFVNYAPHVAKDMDHSYALERYQREYRRLLSVMERQLGQTKYLAGDEYTIADMISFPWVLPYKMFGANLDDFPIVRKWFDELKQRPGVRRGVNIMKDVKRFQAKDASKQTLETMFKKSKM